MSVNYKVEILQKYHMFSNVVDLDPGKLKEFFQREDIKSGIEIHVIIREYEHEEIELEDSKILFSEHIMYNAYTPFFDIIREEIINKHTRELDRLDRAESYYINN